MKSIHKNRLAVIKYDPMWQEIAEVNITVDEEGMKEIKNPANESLLLNEIAKAHPFCIMYHTKKHDPL